MQRWVQIGLALLLAAGASAAVLSGDTTTNGSLTVAQTATGASQNSVAVGRTKARNLILSVWNTAGTATVQLEINCTSPQVAAGWAVVANTSSALTVSGVGLNVLYPGCEYRTNVTACSTCSVNAQFFLGPDIT